MHSGIENRAFLLSKTTIKREKGGCSDETYANTTNETSRSYGVLHCFIPNGFGFWVVYGFSWTYRLTSNKTGGNT